MKTVDDYEYFIRDKLIDRFSIEKVPGINRSNNKLIKLLKPRLIEFIHFFNPCINYGIQPSGWKIANNGMLHKTCKTKNLIESYRPLRCLSCYGKLLEKTIADNKSN